MSNPDSDIAQIKSILKDLQQGHQELVSRFNVITSSLPQFVLFPTQGANPCYEPQCIPGTKSPTPCVIGNCDGHATIICTKSPPLLCGHSLCAKLTGKVIGSDLSIEFNPPIDETMIETAHMDGNTGYSWRALDPTSNPIPGMSGHSSPADCITTFHVSAPLKIKFIIFNGTGNDILVRICHHHP